MTSFSVHVDEFVYETRNSEVSWYGDVTGAVVLPRGLISFSGLLFEVSSLGSADGEYKDQDWSRPSMCIPSSIVSIAEKCFSSCVNLCFVAFESCSRLSIIETGAFQTCLCLKSICIPSGVQSLSVRCFSSCRDLSTVTFAYHSQLSRIERHAFVWCDHLRSICLPAGLEHIEPVALNWSSLQHVGIEVGNRYFSISGGFVLDCAGISIVGHVGAASKLCIGNGIEELRDSSCAGPKNMWADLRTALSSVWFEPGSRLRRIGEFAFENSSLTVIVIPASVEIIGRCCFSGSDRLSIVRFESNSRLAAIEEQAFQFCPALKTVSIPCCIETIVADHFRGHSALDIVLLETGAVLHGRPVNLFGSPWE
jgi:hypothetical protein